MDWARDGRDWPHHEHSRFVDSGGLRWHVQQWPAPSAQAPQLLLLHGTGASTHSWRDLAPLLARHAGVVALDLPGHGFSDRRARRRRHAARHGARRGGAAARAAACSRRCWSAIRPARPSRCRWRWTRPLGLRAVVSLNGALLPLHGLAGQLFSPLAKLLAANRLVPQLFAWRAAEPSRVRRLVDGTGSTLDDAGVGALRPAGARPGACGRRAGDDGPLGPARWRRAAAAARAAAPAGGRTRPAVPPSQIASACAAVRAAAPAPPERAAGSGRTWRTRKSRSRPLELLLPAARLQRAHARIGSVAFERSARAAAVQEQPLRPACDHLLRGARRRLPRSSAQRAVQHLAVRPRASDSSTASMSSPRASCLRARVSAASRQASARALTSRISGTLWRWSSQCAKPRTPASTMASACATAAWRFSPPDCTSIDRSSTV